jgi:hypothetical protein
MSGFPWDTPWSRSEGSDDAGGRETRDQRDVGFVGYGRLGVDSLLIKTLMYFSLLEISFTISIRIIRKDAEEYQHESPLLSPSTVDDSLSIPSLVAASP